MFPDHATLPSGGRGANSSGANSSGANSSGANSSGANSSGGNDSAGFAGALAMGGAGFAGSAGFPSGGAADGGGAGGGVVGGVGGSPETGGAAGAPTVHSGGQGGSVGCSAPVTLKLVATADAHLSEAKSDQRANFGDAPRLLLSGVVDARARALVNFDLSALPGGHDIVRATLRLVVAASATGERTLSAYRVGREWQEDKATWVRAQTAPTTNWTLPGGDTALVVSDTRTVVDAAPGTAIDFQVEADLGGTIPVGDPGFGWLLDVAASEGIVELSSRESLFEEERPELVLELCPSDDGP